MIYCEQYDDEEVISELGGRQKILIVGCAGCANASLYIARGKDGEAMLALSMKGYRPLSMLAEVERITSVPKPSRRSVGSWVGRYPLQPACMLNQGARAQIKEAADDRDAVLTLCCEGGAANIGGIVGEHKVVKAMRAVGLTRGVPIKLRGMMRIALERSSVQIIPVGVSSKEPD